MKRILTIAIVICLAVTMTCSSMAVEERGLKAICPNCGEYGDSVRYTNCLVETTTTPCPHGYDVRDTVQYYADYTQISCPYCGTVSDSEYTNIYTVMICNGG